MVERRTSALDPKRHTDRVEAATRVTVYSNLPEVELFANGVSLGKKTAKDHFFRFEVPNGWKVGGRRLRLPRRERNSQGKDFQRSLSSMDKGAVLNWFGTIWSPKVSSPE